MKRGITIFGFFLLIFFGLRYNSAPFLSVKEYRLIQTGLLSDDYFSSISTCVGKLLDDHYSAQQLIAHVKKEFSVLNKVVVAYRPCGVYVMMYAHKPVCCINDDLVLTVNNELFPKNYFAVSSLDSIAHITVAQEYIPKVFSCVPSLLRELPSDFNETYNLELFNEHCVHLADKQEKHFSIIASVAQKNISMSLAQCASVKKNVSERKDFDKGIKWIADIRFADYIVLYPMHYSVPHGDPAKKYL